MNGEPPRIKLAVLTGGHAFDAPNFQRLFQGMPGVDARVQVLDEFALSSQETRDGYGCILFYHMLKGSPLDASQPEISARRLSALERIQETGQGLVVMHHALLAYAEWPAWRELSGINPAYRGYQHDQCLHVRVLNRAHPITAGLADFELVDETYEMDEPDVGCEILLATDHPQSLKAQAWTRRFGRSRVFAWVPGHDHQGWSNPHFAEVLFRGIRWAAAE